MLVLALVAAAGAASLLPQDSSASSDVDPIIGAPLPSADPAAWHTEVRHQNRDPQWAPLAEAKLRQRFVRVSGVGGRSDILRVTCATSICEVAGTVDAPADPRGDGNPNTPLNRTMRELQGKALHDDLLSAGFERQGATFMAIKSKPDRMAFFIYFSRAKR